MQNLYNGLFVDVNHIGNHLKALTLIFLNNIAEFCYGFLKILIGQSTCLFVKWHFHIHLLNIFIFNFNFNNYLKLIKQY